MSYAQSSKVNYAPEVKRKAAALLELRRRSGAGHPVFRGAAREIQSLRAQEWILSGPSETGKTFAALWLLDSLMQSTPGEQGALIRKLRSTMDGTVLVTYRRVIAQSGSGAVAYGGENAQWFDYPNGARLWVGGMDNPQKILSGERGYIYVNQAEDLSQPDWETLSTRATGRGAVTQTPMLFGDCNPGGEDHWILRRRDDGALRLLESRHVDNPSLYTDDGTLTEQGERSMAVLNKLTGARKKRLRFGLWVGAEGQFFEAWDEDIHVIAPFTPPADWPVWGAFDYGFSHPTAFGVFTSDNDGRVYLLGEHVQHKWLPTQHAPAMDALVARLGIPKARLRRTVAGHDVFANRGDSEGRTIAEQYAALGWAFERAQIDRINGAAALLTRLGNTEAGTSITLFIVRTCARTIATIPRMVGDPNRPEDVKKVDADADGMGGDDPYDMLRYGIMNKPLVSQPAQVGPTRPQYQQLKVRR